MRPAGNAAPGATLGAAPPPAQGAWAQDALWHLVALGVLTGDHAPRGWDPARVRCPARVAVIDTSVAMDHPNLRDAIDRALAFDLVSTRLGAFPGRDGQAPLGRIALGDTRAAVAGLPGCSALLQELTARLAPDRPAWLGRLQPATSPVFSGHGTAIAGLIGARPVQVAGPDGAPLALPYCGVDPTCRIVPISTGFDTDPEQMILAFLYADLIGADVIVLPRHLPDPLRTVPELSSRSLAGQSLGDLVAPCPVPETARELWAELAELVLKISLRRPIVCAAGNENEDYGIYPANLASDDNGVISVGAVNALGWPCSYSPADTLTVWAPSTDAERFDRTEMRLDPLGPHPEGIPEGAFDRFSPLQVISTDVPGQGGYATSPHEGPEPEDGLREFGSYFCRFGGTSAACAIIGGLLALATATGRLPPRADGLEAKAWLMSQCLSPPPETPELRVPTLGAVTFTAISA